MADTIPKVSTSNARVRALARAVRASHLESAGEFEALALGLRGQQARLWQLLRERGEADTVAVRTHCSVGNVSEAATAINGHLERAGDLRRVICVTSPHVNKFGERGVLGTWRIVDAAANDAETAP